jgi:RHS repeat-associated protein
MTRHPRITGIHAMSTSFSAGRASMAAAFRLLVSTLRPELARGRLVKVAALMLTLVTVGVAPANAQEVVEYYGTDALGSIRVVFATDGTVKARSDYLPFGEEWQPATNGGPLPMQRFTGQQRDIEENLDYFNARSYQARTGRFTTVDPVFTGLFEPQRWNRYSYALNSPLVFTDPDGLNAQSCTQSGYVDENGVLRWESQSCREEEGGGGFWTWTFLRGLDTFLMADPVGGDESELVPTRRGRYVPSKSVEAATDATILVVAIAIPGDQGESKAAATLVSRGDELLDLFKNLAQQAADKIGPGKGSTHGTKTHSVFQRLVDGLGRGDLKTEVSYKAGEVVKRGTPGSVRVDLVEGPVKSPTVIYDLKTGGATLTERRVDQIQSHVGGPKVPVVQVKP